MKIKKDFSGNTNSFTDPYILNMTRIHRVTIGYETEFEGQL